MNELTLAFIATVAVVAVVFDIWTLERRGLKSTISWQLLLVAQRWPIIPFALGVVAGHLFWSQVCA